MHSASVIKLFLSRSKGISTNLLSYAWSLAGFPSTPKMYIVQLASLRGCTSFMHARHISCCEQPIQSTPFELLHCFSHRVLHCPGWSLLARQCTPAACHRRRRDDGALRPAAVLDISGAQISLPATNNRTFQKPQRLLLTSCSYKTLLGNPPLYSIVSGLERQKAEKRNKKELSEKKEKN